MTKYICVYTGNGLFVGDVWQVYRHNPSGDTEDTICYVNHEPEKLYKSEEACQNQCDELNKETE